MMNKLTVGALALALSSPTFVAAADQDLKLSTKGGFKIYTADQQYSFKIGGRIMWDYDATTTNGDTERSVEVRRARLAFAGSAGDWSYKSQFNIAESKSIDSGTGGTAEDLYIRYNGLDNMKVTIGKQKQHFGLEAMTSSKYITIIERSAFSETYFSGRSVGVNLEGKAGAIHYAAGIFDGDRSDEDVQNTDNVSFASRVVYTPVNEKGNLIHTAFSFHTAQDFTKTGLEVATVQGPLHAQAEYATMDDNGETNSSVYAQVGYFITGETRSYKNGQFQKVKPNAESGALEVALRVESGYGKYSDLGLNKVEGQQVAVGLNWYANQNVRMSASYMAGEEDESGDDGSELRLRAQFIF